MTFLNPLLLMGLAATAIPVVIHLLTRRRPRRTPFSSVEFLREVRLAEMRRFRLREWILLLLRVLAIACLALALARPALQGSVFAGKGSTTSFLLIDASLSMAMREGDTPLFEHARDRALEVLDALEPEDRVQVMVFDEGVRTLFREPVEDHGRARAAIQGLTVGGGATDLEAALSASIEALSSSPSLNRELYVFTDLQRSGISGEPPVREVPRGTRVHFLTLAENAPPMNRTVSSVRYRPGEPPSVEVDVQEFGEDAGSPGESGEVTVTAQALVERGRWREAGRGFVASGSTGGGLVILRERVPLGGWVELAPDALTEDDRRAFVAGQSGAVRVALVSEGIALDLALQTGVDAGRFVLTRLEPGQLVSESLVGVEVLVLDDVGTLGDGALQTVVDFARRGGGVAIVLGPSTNPQFLNGRLFPALGDLRIVGEAPRAAQGGGWAMRRAAVGHPALDGFADGVGEALSQAEFTTAWQVNAGSEGRVLARFASDLPALIERERVLIFTSDVSGAWSDFLLSGTFLPMWHQALIHLGQGNTTELRYGDRLDVPVPAGEGQAVWTVQTPDGRDLPVQVRLSGGAPRLLSPPLDELGLHLLVASGRVVRSIAVTPNLVESNLARIDPAEARDRWPALAVQFVEPGARAETVVREGRYGRELWREMLLLALLFLAAEMIFARSWGARSRALEESEDEGPVVERRAVGA